MYTADMQTADGAPAGCLIELEADCNGLVSFQKYSFGVVLVDGGWGATFGNDWGGALVDGGWGANFGNDWGGT